MFPIVSTMIDLIKFKSALYVSSVFKRTARTVFLTKRNKIFQMRKHSKHESWMDWGRKGRLLSMIHLTKCHTNNTLKSQCFFYFFFKLTRVTTRSLIVWPNAGLFQKQDQCTVDLRSSALSLATYLLDAA